MPDEKDTQFYAASVTAWFNTKLERDKSLLALSAGGIGLLVTLLTTIGVKSVEGLILYVSAIISFVVCVLSVLSIYSRNATYLEEVLQNQDRPDLILRSLDKAAIFAFILGIILSSILGISAATDSLYKREANMAGENKKNELRETLKESFDGASKLRPGGQQGQSGTGTSGSQGSNQGQGGNQGQGSEKDK